MSVDICLMQVSLEQLATYQEQPATLITFVAEMAEHFGLQKLAEPINRMLYIEEFALSLLTDPKTTYSTFEPIHRAIMFPGHTFSGVGYEYGGVGFHTVGEARSLYESLSGFPQANLQAHLALKLASLREVYSEADFQYLRTYFQHIHLAGVERIEIEEAVRQYQQVCFERLVAFFEQVSQQGNAVLLIVR